MYFCQDVELMAWEPGAFFQTVFSHQIVVRNAVGTLTGTALVLTSGSLSPVQAGMVAQVTLADGSLAQLLEVVTVADAMHATLSALRGRSSEPAVPPLTGGSVKVSVMTFMPQIAAVGDDLLALVGVDSDRNSQATPAYSALCGFKPATIFGTLAAIYRTLSDAPGSNALTQSKRTFYEGLAQASRETLSATIDRDGDGYPETRRWSGVQTLERA